MAPFPLTARFLMVLLGLSGDNCLRIDFTSTDSNCRPDEIYFSEKCRELICPPTMKPVNSKCHPTDGNTTAIQAKMNIRFDGGFDIATLESMSEEDFIEFSKVIRHNVRHTLNLSQGRSLEGCEECSSQFIYTLNDETPQAPSNATTMPTITFPDEPGKQPHPPTNELPLNAPPDSPIYDQNTQPPISNTLTLILTIRPIPEKNCSAATVLDVFHKIHEKPKIVITIMQGMVMSFALYMSYESMDNKSKLHDVYFTPTDVYQSCDNIENLEVKFYCPSFEINHDELETEEIANYMMERFHMEAAPTGRLRVCVDAFKDLFRTPGPPAENGGFCLRSTPLVIMLGVLLLDLSVAFG